MAAPLSQSGGGNRLAARCFLAAILTLTLSPIAYLLWRAGLRELSLLELFSDTPTLRRLGQSTLLAVLVLLASIALALPLALAAQGLSRRRRKVLDLLVVSPLAVPGYVLAYTLLAVGGDEGPLVSLGLRLPRLDGLWGATLALTLYNQPYLYLTLCSALDRLGAARWEAARSLGEGRWRALWRAVFPAIRPALMVGGLMITLYVLGDFGVASLMRVDTLSYAIYSNWASRAHAARLALILALQAGMLLTLYGLLQKDRLALGGGARGFRFWRPPSGRETCFKETGNGST